MMNKHFLIDIDGTLVDSAGQPIYGAVSWLNRRVAEGDKYVLITNNTQKTPRQIYEELIGVGFQVEISSILSCLSATTDILRQEDVTSCYIFGNESLKRYFAEEGFSVSENGASVGAVVVGDDPNLTKNRMSAGIRHLLNGAKFIALHKKRICRDRQGEIIMDVGGIVAALEYCSQRAAILMGKPSEDFYLLGINKLTSQPSDIVVISDDPIADLIGAKNMGMKTVFVKTGTYRDDSIISEMSANMRPDSICNNISEYI